MQDYQSIGLDKYGLPLDAPITQDRGFISALTFSANYERSAVTSYQVKKVPWIDMVDGSSVTIDLSKGSRQRVTIAGSRTFVVINGVVGQTFIVRVQQGGSGSNTITWFNTISWAGGATPTLTTTSGKADEFGFVVTGDQTYDGFIVGINI